MMDHHTFKKEKRLPVADATIVIVALSSLCWLGVISLGYYINMLFASF